MELTPEIQALQEAYNLANAALKVTDAFLAKEAAGKALNDAIARIKEGNPFQLP